MLSHALYPLTITLSLLISHRNAQQNPTISFISKEKVVDIGDSLELHCAVAYSRDYPVIWIKANKDNPNNYLFISRGSTINVPESRYSVRHDEKQSTYTLVISKVQEIDAGDYQCEIITGTSSKVSIRLNPF